EKSFRKFPTGNLRSISHGERGLADLPGCYSGSSIQDSGQPLAELLKRKVCFYRSSSGISHSPAELVVLKKPDQPIRENIHTVIFNRSEERRVGKGSIC